MRVTQEIVATQGVVHGNDMVTASRLARRRLSSNRFDFESIVLRIARTIEPDADKLMAWYRDTPIADMDALTAEKLVRLGRGREVITFLNSIRLGAKR